jgi:hypothetical protein
VVRSPFQRPRFTAIRSELFDGNGDGMLDSVRFTARRGGKTVIRVVPV